MNQRLSGKVVLVTGASRGIGQALAIGVGRAGARVAVNYKSDLVGAQATCLSIREAGADGEAFQADIGCKSHFESLVDSVCSRFGRMDVLVNNAARTCFRPFFEVTEQDFDEVVNTDLRGPFFGSMTAARQMLTQRGGSIINISSCAVRLMIPNHSVYTMAKGGLESLTRQLAIELAPFIRVNAIAPAATSTERNRGYDADYDSKWSAQLPARRVARVEDYVGPCVFLASDDSAFVSGQILSVDSGWSLRGCVPDVTTKDVSHDPGVV